jgi:hypothetical protein
MDPMSDVSMCDQLLVAHLLHCMLCFGLQWESLAGLKQFQYPKLMAFTAMTHLIRCC